jgi:hypothetical protein
MIDTLKEVAIKTATAVEVAATAAGSTT